MKNRAIRCTAWLTSFLAGGLAQADSTVVENIRIGLIEGRTRIVLDLNEAADHRVFSLDGPDRVVLDLSNTETSIDTRKLWLKNTGLQAVRTGEHPDSRLRIVLDLEESMELRSFALDPAYGKGHRIVVDLYHRDTGNTQTAASSLGLEPLDVDLPTPGDTDRDRPGRTEQTDRLETQRTAPDPRPKSISDRSEQAEDEVFTEWTGFLSLDTRLFTAAPKYEGQERNSISLAFQPEFFAEWDDGNQQFRATPFLRLDSADDERTHFDLRQLFWRWDGRSAGVRVGADIVFWGVAESRHLVDVINQTDFVENIDGEDKLGQPMINPYLNQGWGNLELFILPWFRERTFPGVGGRLRPPLPLNTDAPIYESSREERHIDYAVRWSHYIGDWDVGVAYFKGTARDPLFVFDEDLGLRPFYQQMEQASLDLQATIGPTLWKLEALYNQNNTDSGYAFVGGIEHTQYGLFGSPSDLGFLMEYHKDQREQLINNGFFEDLFLGLRWTVNNIAGGTLLAGVSFDMESDAAIGTLEGSWRLGEFWRLEVEGRGFSSMNEASTPIFFLQDDDYVEVRFLRSF